MSDFQARFKNRFVVVGKNGELEPAQAQPSPSANAKGFKSNQPPTRTAPVNKPTVSPPAILPTTQLFPTQAESEAPHRGGKQESYSHDSQTVETEQSFTPPPALQIVDAEDEHLDSNTFTTPEPTRRIISEMSHLASDPEFQEGDLRRIPNSPSPRTTKPHSERYNPPDYEQSGDADVSFSESQDANSLRAMFMAPITPKKTTKAFSSLNVDDSLTVAYDEQPKRSTGPTITPRHTVIDPMFRQPDPTPEEDLQVADASRLRDLLQTASVIKPPPPPIPQQYGSPSSRAISPPLQRNSASPSRSSGVHDSREPGSNSFSSVNQHLAPGPMSRGVPGKAPADIGNLNEVNNSSYESQSSSRSFENSRSQGGGKKGDFRSGASGGGSLLVPREKAKAGVGFGGGIDGIARKAKPNSYLSIMNYGEKGTWQSPEEIALEKEKQRRAALRLKQREGATKRRFQVQCVQRRIAANTGLFIAVPRGYTIPPFEDEHADPAHDNAGNSEVQPINKVIYSASKLTEDMLPERAVTLIQSLRAGGIRIRDSSVFLFNLPFPFPKSISRALGELIPLSEIEKVQQKRTDPNALAAPSENLTLVAYLAAYLRILDDLKILPSVALRAAIEASKVAEIVQMHSDSCAISEGTGYEFDASKDGELTPKERSEIQSNLQAEEELVLVPSGYNVVSDVIPEELEAVLRKGSVPEVRALWHALPDPPNGLALAEQYYIYMRQVLSTSFSNNDSEDNTQFMNPDFKVDFEDIEDNLWSRPIPEHISEDALSVIQIKKSTKLPAALYQNYVMLQHKRAIEEAQQIADEEEEDSMYTMPDTSSKSQSHHSATNSRRTPRDTSTKSASRTGSFRTNSNLSSATSALQNPASGGHVSRPSLVPEIPAEIAAAVAALGVDVADTIDMFRHEEVTEDKGETGRGLKQQARAQISASPSRKVLTVADKLKAAREMREQQNSDETKGSSIPVGFPIGRDRSAGYKPYTLKDWQVRPAIAPPPRLGPDLQRDDLVAAAGRRAKMIQTANKIKSRNNELLAAYRLQPDIDLSKLPNSRDPDFLDGVSPRLAELERSRQGSISESRKDSGNSSEGSNKHQDSSDLESNQDEPDMDFDDLVAAATAAEFAKLEMRPEPIVSVSSEISAPSQKRTTHSLLPAVDGVHGQSKQSKANRAGRPRSIATGTSGALGAKPQLGAGRVPTPILPSVLSNISKSTIPKATASSSTQPPNRAQVLTNSRQKSGITSAVAHVDGDGDDALDKFVKESPTVPQYSRQGGNLEELTLVQKQARQRAAEVRRSLRVRK